jgi:protoporphyrinogen oxidase
MSKIKYLILGAGPAGLTFSNYLKQHGENSFLVLEKQHEAGGLCRSQIVDGAPLDIGGGHFLDTKDKIVNDFLFQFMPLDEWNRFERNSQIFINDSFINSPIEANIWQMKVEEQVEYLKTIAVAGCNLNVPKPEKFRDWIYWKLGDKIAVDYMIPYNTKMFSRNLDELGTYWLEKLPNVSFEQTLLSCLNHKAYGSQPAHTEFLYPKKYGYGEVWLRMADNIQNNIQYDVKVDQINFIDNTINRYYNADYIISTIPWNEFTELFGIPEELWQKIRKIKHNSIQIQYIPKNMETDAHWIYYPQLELPYHRVLIRHNFYELSSGYWTETNFERVKLIRGMGSNNNFTFLNDYAYPLNTIDKPTIMTELLSWTKKHKVYGLGRWGEHQHYNSDVTVALALKMAKEFIGE